MLHYSYHYRNMLSDPNNSKLKISLPYYQYELWKYDSTIKATPAILYLWGASVKLVRETSSSRRWSGMLSSASNPVLLTCSKERRQEVMKLCWSGSSGNVFYGPTYQVHTFRLWNRSFSYSFKLIFDTHSLSTRALLFQHSVYQNSGEEYSISARPTSYTCIFYYLKVSIALLPQWNAWNTSDQYTVTESSRINTRCLMKIVKYSYISDQRVRFASAMSDLSASLAVHLCSFFCKVFQRWSLYPCFT